LPRGYRRFFNCKILSKKGEKARTSMKTEIGEKRDFLLSEQKRKKAWAKGGLKLPMGKKGKRWAWSGSKGR